MSSETLDPSLVRILIVDDEEVVLSALKEQLQSEGFELTMVNSGNKALDALRRESFSIIFAGQEMPGMNGLDLLAKVKENYPAMTRLLLTSTLSLKELLDAVGSNLIHRFLTKPWLREELLVVLRNSVACQLSNLNNLNGAQSDQPGQEPVSEAGGETATDGEASEIASPPQNDDAGIGTFIKMLGTFHPNLGNTAVRAMVLCQKVAEVLDLPPDQTQSLVWAAGLHDISLVGIDRGIVRRWLRSPEKCTEEEMVLIKKHPLESQEMLAAYPAFEEAGKIIRAHHENWDGTGYPERLRGETISWLARVLAVAIYFCSKHQGPAQVMGDVQLQTDKMFDPRAVEAVAKAVPLTELPRGEREILLVELQPGMVLARDIYNTSGVLVIAKGKELTTAWINKILNLNNATPLNPLVLVYC
jgi:response regulator RpfG family c-di-GMP phosphodiesterase